ncbi:hypothetical protein [Deinococcus altitudinis]|uniref:hypothetical protein n=1 Tax=Deinococcus altitudinis TaxID=468914 RepID=UPI003891CA27
MELGVKGSIPQSGKRVDEDAPDILTLFTLLPKLPLKSLATSQDFYRSGRFFLLISEVGTWCIGIR